MKKKYNVIPVILAGGSGTRLWPLSPQNLPKQFQRILSSESLLNETITRFLKIKPKEILILGNHFHLELIKKNLPETKTNISIILEPIQKNTAPAITMAALKANPEDYLLVTPSDHYLPDPNILLTKVQEIGELTEDDSIFLFGIKPSYPSLSYGYIEKGKKSGFTYEVKSFKEKPNKKKAEIYLKKKKYLWNTGIFLFRVEKFLDEMKKVEPKILKLCKQAIINSNIEGNTIHVNEQNYKKLDKISIDYALLEKSNSLKVIEIDTAWGDLGTWKSIKDHSSKDKNKNTVIGNVHINKVNNSYINIDKKNVILSGLDNLLIVERNDQLLITETNSINDIENKFKDFQETNLNSEFTDRPWGRFKTLFKNINCHVKLLIIEKNGKLSLQKHRHRSEHWTIAAGKAKVVKGKKEIKLSKDDSIKIKKGEIHRITNIGNDDLHIIEVQIGEYFGEDDIQRFEDIYDRK